jgi:VWFA-related protein
MKLLPPSPTVCVLLLLLLSAAPDAAQMVDGSTPELVLRRSAEEVVLSFSVTDSEGRLVDGLQVQDFAVLDNDQAIRHFTSFQKDCGLALRLGLLVDLSDSTAKAFRAEQAAAIGFLQGILRPEGDEAFVLGFRQTSDVKVRSERDATRLIEALNRFRPGGQTALYDAIFQATTQELMLRQEQHPVRRVLVLLSDGEDNDSWRTAAQAIQAAQRADVAIYAIALRRMDQRSQGDNILRRLTAETGGRILFFDNHGGNAEMFSRLEQELRGRYTITYRRAEAPLAGGFHQLRVVIDSQRKLQAHCKVGYYAFAQQELCEACPASASFKPLGQN